LTLTRTGQPPGLYEMPLGQSLHALLEACNQPADDLHGALLGGYFAGLINTRILHTSIDYDSLIAIGTGLGCGAITLLGPQDCPVAAAAAVMAYFDRENAGQCGSCFNGTAAMSAVLGALRDHVAQLSDVERLAGWSVSLRSRGACATLDGATNIAASLLHEFPHVVTAHLEGECGVCRNAPPLPERPFAVDYQPTGPVVSEANSR
jgi:NADH:ubiquinone oxidoreductase subunit F (NADH-binding)